MAALNAVFGYDFIVFRVYGIFERIFLVSMVYLICRRMFKPWISAFATIASLALYGSFNADVIYSYYQLSMAFVLLSLWLLLKFFDEEDPSKKLAYATLVGVSCSLSFMVKQTLGLAFPLVAVMLIVLKSVKTKGSSGQLGKSLALFTAGYASIIALFSIFFMLTNSFDEYISQVYLGTSSKGSIGSILSGSIRLILENHLDRTLLFATVLIASAIVYVTVGNLLAERSRREDSTAQHSNKGEYAWIAVIALALATLIMPFLFLSFFETSRLAGASLFDTKRYFVNALFIVSVIIGVFYFHRTVFKSHLYTRELAVAATSFTIMYVHGFSGVIEEHSTVLIFGFVIGTALSYKGILNAAKQLAVMLSVSVLMLVCSVQRMTWPYEWWGWREPSISVANTTVSVPRMSGLYMSERTANMYQTVYDSLKGQIDSDDYLYTFPHIKAFDNIFGTIPPTFADVHYWDVCPDDIAVADSNVLRANPPKAIVYMDLPEQAWSFHEHLFRNDAKSGQREIRRFVEEGIQSGQYRVLNDIPASGNARILVLLRSE
jgi:4-amino-4-deoxy-L-arabinose transferase-like glycosyltransferase